MQEYKGAKYSSEERVPYVGEVIKVTMNNLGLAEVTEVTEVDGFVGLQVKLVSPPEWYTKQNNGNPVSCVFGSEVRLLGAQE